MLDMIARWTSLPNIHPLLVHFPIALLPTALALELVGLLRARPWWASRAAVVLLILAAVLTYAAYEAGEEAAEGLTRVPPAAQPALAEHDAAASWALRLTVLALLLRIAVAFHGRSRVAWYRAERGLSAMVTALAVVAVAWTADLGGRLVYDHGLAVRAMPALTKPEVEGSMPTADETETGEQEAEEPGDSPAPEVSAPAPSSTGN